MNCKLLIISLLGILSCKCYSESTREVQERLGINREIIRQCEQTIDKFGKLNEHISRIGNSDIHRMIDIYFELKLKIKGISYAFKFINEKISERRLAQNLVPYEQEAPLNLLIKILAEEESNLITQRDKLQIEIISIVNCDEDKIDAERNEAMNCLSKTENTIKSNDKIELNDDVKEIINKMRAVTREQKIETKNELIINAKVCDYSFNSIASAIDKALEWTSARIQNVKPKIEVSNVFIANKDLQQCSTILVNFKSEAQSVKACLPKMPTVRTGEPASTQVVKPIVELKKPIISILKMKSGEQITTNSVIKANGNYLIKNNSGETVVVPEDDVIEIVKQK